MQEPDKIAITNQDATLNDNAASCQPHQFLYLKVFHSSECNVSLSCFLYYCRGRILYVVFTQELSGEYRAADFCCVSLFINQN
jgi:hypothetical protein